MAGALLKRMFSCRHQFSWPRRSGAGEYYQVCLECGIQYRYDWNKMRRTSRIDRESAAIEAGAKKPPRKCGAPPPAVQARSHWNPRERRLRWEQPILFRSAHNAEWQHGQTENVSRSGLLFHADTACALGAKLELILEMPSEITGAGGRKVICQAKVARVTPGTEKQPALLAVTIGEYQILPAGEVAGL